MIKEVFTASFIFAVKESDNEKFKSHNQPFRRGKKV